MIRLQKVSNEGTSSPFIARLFVGVLEIRDLFAMGNDFPPNPEISKGRFDELYKPIFEALEATRDTATSIMKITEDHAVEITKGQIVKFQANAYEVNKSVDNSLRQELGKLLDQGVIASKDGIQKIQKELLGHDIGFLYQKVGTYERGKTSLRSTGHSGFADYLEQVRDVWLESFLKIRNDQRHEGWTLDSVSYHLVAPNQVQVTFPKISGTDLSEFARNSANRVLLFIENVIAYSFQSSGRSPIILQEIPEHERDPANKTRFRAVPNLPEFSPWRITFEDGKDFV